MFYVDGDCVDIGDAGNHNAACEDFARAAHRTMLAHFGLHAEQLPFLKLDLFDWERPFSIAV